METEAGKTGETGSEKRVQKARSNAKILSIFGTMRILIGGVGYANVVFVEDGVDLLVPRREILVCS